MRRIDRRELRAPSLVVDLRLDGDLDLATLDTREYASLWCLVRVQDVPVGTGCWDVSGNDDVSVEALRVAERAALPPGERPTLPKPAAELDLTVALCTRERPGDLRRALLSLAGQTDAGFRTVVVDNAPVGSATREVVDEVGLPQCRYIVEPVAGLSRARNAALAVVGTSLVAWMDDDETADRFWVERIKQGFGHPCRPAAVSGLMLPAELETDAQVRFEQYGGFNKGRGFTPEVLSTRTGSVRSPMYPLPNFGAGGNMAFRVDALRDAGGFDPYLGAGTRTHGGEETRALALVLRAGGAVLHWPAAVTWHYHRRETAELRDQFRGYGAGLSAFFTSMLLSTPATSAAELLRVIPTAIAHTRPGRGNRRIGGLPSDFPSDLRRAGRVGFTEGGVAYLRERRSAHHAPPSAGRGNQ